MDEVIQQSRREFIGTAAADSRSGPRPAPLRLSPDLGAAAPRGLADQSEARPPALASGEASFVTGSELVIDYRALIFTSGNIPSTSPFITGCWLPPTIRDFRVTCCSTYS